MAPTRNAWTRGRYRWQVAAPWPSAAEKARRLKTSPLIAQVLHNRGLDDLEAMRKFLRPKLTDLHAPELLSDMDVAAERMCRAARSRERTYIYGDYDVDGMTGLAILYRCLAACGADVHYYVPHRLEEGYGVNTQAIDRIAGDGAKLLITVDCGISAIEPLRRARQLGMDVIVTDHHDPGPTLPDVVAVVHPALPAGGLSRQGAAAIYPNPDLSGAGVAFKLAWQFSRAMCGAEHVDEATREFLLEATSLAALGTIADVVPLLGENRVLATYGLRGLAVTPHVGIRALLASARLTGEKLDAYHVGFRLGPRLNACGRMGHARSAVELLTCAGPDRARRIAARLERLNTQRQQIERQIFKEAVDMVESGAAAAPTDFAIVLASPSWHAGVVGIVASRLVDRFHRPAVLIAVDGEEARGSGRSIEPFHIREALAECSDALTSFGGHAMAAGLSLPTRNVERFAAALARIAAERLSASDLRPTLRVDAEVNVAELPQSVVEHLERLAPFGQGNPRPVVAVRGCRILTPPQRLGRNGATLSFLVGQNDSRLRCVGFGMGELADALTGIPTVDIVGSPMLNRFNGRTNVEMHLRDVARA